MALLQHIVSGKILSSAELAVEGEPVTIFSDGDNLVTDLNGNEYTVTVSESGVMVANANLLEADLILSNGAIHVIDAVLRLPYSLDR